MVTFLNELHLFGLIFFLVFGYQISFYFLYLYRKNRKENLGLNKLFLAYGLLFGLGLTGIVFRAITDYYIQDPDLNFFLIKATHIIIFLAAISFQIILSLKDFNDILNVKFSRSITIYTLFVSMLILFLEPNELSDLLVLISIFLGFSFMVFFHYRLITNSYGEIKKRLVIITIGSAIMIIGLLIGSKEIISMMPPVIQDISLLILNSLVYMGFLIIFLGAYDFPIFLEFNWQQHLLKLYVINSKDKIKLYSHDFTKQERRIDIEDAKSLLLTKGIVGIDYVLSKITDTQRESTKKIRHGEILILLDYYENLIFALLVEREMESLLYFLKKIKKHFVEYYKSILGNLDSIKGSEENFFSSFNILINDLINYK